MTVRAPGLRPSDQVARIPLGPKSCNLDPFCNIISLADELPTLASKTPTKQRHQPTIYGGGELDSEGDKENVAPSRDPLSHDPAPTFLLCRLAALRISRPSEAVPDLPGGQLRPASPLRRSTLSATPALLPATPPPRAARTRRTIITTRYFIKDQQAAEAYFLAAREAARIATARYGHPEDVPAPILPLISDLQSHFESSYTPYDLPPTPPLKAGSSPYQRGQRSLHRLSFAPEQVKRDAKRRVMGLWEELLRARTGEPITGRDDLTEGLRCGNCMY
ncbi:uncharacterized protein MKK02DRAFT_45798 [Dioszegia hungarica]|uniref:Uncharacterized protein n=1 Tax=Dioszegia hungarica TaxID=4972 RepID=A0AA38HAC4_9TREE|nr:uncharacterized protein MKK02DRAFT_45798 [Dioszegia hungarica]KAI9637090.1 hypothetical protein MKK02DRAFT_45798 [Dioszegia hungarica]